MKGKTTIKMSLRKRVYLANAVLLGITVFGAVAMIWYTYKTETHFSGIVDKNLVIYQSAETLKAGLLNQKGFLSYYLLDHDPDWIRQMGVFQDMFNRQLATVQMLVEDPWEKEAVNRIETKYRRYINIKDRVIEMYTGDRVEAGTRLHKEVRAEFLKIVDLCEQFKAFHRRKIDQAVAASERDANQLRYIALLAIVTVVLMSFLINYIFTRHILEPIRKLAEAADRAGDSKSPGNEMIALKKSVHGLIEDAEQAHQELKRSRETLMQSEKMAILGKLAAGTAHSIRNPLTSVNMRLFSLGRSCRFTSVEEEDFNVISNEIDHINMILENFLEFARPPKLTMVRMSPSHVVDKTLRLLDQRLKSYDVKVRVERDTPLAHTRVDPGQLKEALVNIIINACEAMGPEGHIHISEHMDRAASLGPVAVVTIRDNGPGIPEAVRDEIFNPFFTTKEAGTGLGLSIAFNIISEHGGWLNAGPAPGGGAMFTITLPVKDD